MVNDDDSPVPADLRQQVAFFTNALRSRSLDPMKLLAYVTGTMTLKSDGSLTPNDRADPPNTIVIKFDATLPVDSEMSGNAHTCFYVLDLAHYSSQDQMVKDLAVKYVNMEFSTVER